MKRFDTTPWSLIIAAQGQGDADSSDALEELCQLYWFPLYGFVRRRGYGKEEAEDLTQSFFVSLLEKNFVEFVDRTRGRFRSFLLTALSHFLSDAWDRSQALKRGGQVKHISLDVDQAENLFAEVSALPLTPEQMYDRSWAKTLSAAALGDVRLEYARKNRANLLEAIEGYVVSNTKRRKYKDVAQEIGMSENGVKTAVYRLRRQLGEAMRSRIAKTLDDPEEIEVEMKYLLDLL